MKRYFYGALIIFLVLFLGSVFVTAKLNSSLLTGNFLEFIEIYFNQWSPTLGAIGTFLAVVVAFIAIIDTRHNQKLATLEIYYSRIESWASENREYLEQIKWMYNFIEIEDRPIRELDLKSKELKEQQAELDKKDKTEEVNLEIRKNAKEQIKVNGKLLQLVQSKQETLSKNTEIIRPLHIKLYSEIMLVSPIVTLINDKVILDNFLRYSTCTSAMTSIFAEKRGIKDNEQLNIMESALQTIVARIAILRNHNTNAKSFS